MCCTSHFSKIKDRQRGEEIYILTVRKSKIKIILILIRLPVGEELALPSVGAIYKKQIINIWVGGQII
jgi:hypothetical protein